MGHGRSRFAAIKKLPLERYSPKNNGILSGAERVCGRESLREWGRIGSKRTAEEAPMTNGYEEARGQRNWLERLGDKIPGYRGFQDRELRRDVDRLLREHLASELGRLKAVAARPRPRLHRRRQDRRPQRLRPARPPDRRPVAGHPLQRLRGQRPVRPGEDRRAELQRLYEFDLSVVNDLAQLESDVAALPAPGGDDPAPALDRLLQEVAGARRQVAAARAGDQQRGAGRPGRAAPERRLAGDRRLRPWT